MLAALHELECAGFARLVPVQEADGIWTTSARVLPSPRNHHDSAMSYFFYNEALRQLL